MEQRKDDFLTRGLESFKSFWSGMSTQGKIVTSIVIVVVAVVIVSLIAQMSSKSDVEKSCGQTASKSYVGSAKDDAVKSCLDYHDKFPTS